MTIRSFFNWFNFQDRAPMTNDNVDLSSTPFKLDDRTREAAHRALDRWIEESEVQADRIWEDGRSGYLGEIVLRASVSDDGVTLRIERAFEEDL